MYMRKACENEKVKELDLEEGGLERESERELQDVRHSGNMLCVDRKTKYFLRVKQSVTYESLKRVTGADTTT